MIDHDPNIIFIDQEDLGAFLLPEEERDRRETSFQVHVIYDYINN